MFYVFVTCSFSCLELVQLKNWTIGKSFTDEGKLKDWTKKW